MSKNKGEPIFGFAGEYGFLSNFADNSVMFDGWEFPTAEHAFQAAKTMDPLERAAIQAAPSPFIAKRMGRQLDLRAGWDDGLRDKVMKQIIRSKFSRPLIAANMLVHTQGRDLIEANHWHDNYWGDCVCGNSSVCRRPGQNRLGLILMQQRKKLLKKS